MSTKKEHKQNFAKIKNTIFLMTDLSRSKQKNILGSYLRLLKILNQTIQKVFKVYPKLFLKDKLIFKKTKRCN
jgi:hypothetical protein